jgi:hypothetical protein
MGQCVLIIEASPSDSDTPHSIWHLWTSDQPDSETSTWQHTTFKTDTHAPGGIRTRNPSVWAAAGIGFKNMCQTKTRITQNCILVPFSTACILLPVLWSSCFLYTSIFSLLYYLTMVYPCSRRKWGVTNIAAFFRDIPKADCWIHMSLCSNSCSDNVIIIWL